GKLGELMDRLLAGGAAGERFIDGIEALDQVEIGPGDEDIALRAGYNQALQIAPLGEIIGNLLELLERALVEDVRLRIGLIKAELGPALTAIDELVIRVSSHGAMLLFQQQRRPLARPRCTGMRCQTVYCYA